MRSKDGANVREIDAYASHLIDRIRQGDLAAYTAMAEFVDVFLQGRVPQYLGAVDGERLRARARVDIPKAARRLRSTPDRATGWICRKIAMIQKDHAKWVAADRDRGADLQRRLLPQGPLRTHGLDVAFDLRPFDAMSGDFVHYSATTKDVVIAMGDVMGKGSPAALLAWYVLGQLRVLSKRIRDPRRLTSRLDALLSENKIGAEYTTLVVCRWQPDKGHLTICNGGNAPPHLIRQGRVHRLNCLNGVVGMLPGTQFVHERLHIRPGDVLLITSDGLTEPPRRTDTQLSADDFVAAITPQDHQMAESLLRRYWSTLDARATTRMAFDDETIVIMRFE